MPVSNFIETMTCTLNLGDAVQSAGSNKGTGILIVDDEKSVRQGLRLLLELEQGITLLGEARDGFEAIKLNRELQPDLIIMDLNMPGLDGLNATKKLLQEQPWRKVIVLSIQDDVQTQNEIKEAGAIGFVAKRDLGKLLNLIRQTLN